MLTWTSKALLCRSRALANSSLQSPSELFYAVLRTRQRTPRCSLKHIHDSARRSLMTVGDENASSAASKSPTARAPYRILFAGADRFSCTSLELLAKQDSTLLKELSVLVPPDKRTSRGLKNIHRPPLRLLAESLDIPVHEVPATGLRDFDLPPSFLEGQSSEGTDSGTASNLLITASFGYLIPQSMLAHFLPLNTLNVHPSLLPKYRGAAPIQWSIMNGNNDTGVTLQSLGKKFDEGRILAQREFTLSQSVDYLEAEAELAAIGAELLINTLKDLPTAQEMSKAQDPSQATFARKLISADAKVDWEDMTASDIARKHRGLSHQYPLWTSVQGKRLQLLDVQETSQPGEVSNLRTRPGVGILDKKNRLINVQCKDDTWLAIRSLKTEGRRALTPDQWWIGIVKGGQTVQLGPS